jgi:lipooligosaccharide transport system ATP-binding protein
MRLLTAQAIADEGEIQVLGHSLPGDSKAARAEMGVVPQLDNLDTTLTVEQNLRVFAHLYRIPRGERQAAIERALEMSRLVDRRDTRADKLSGGMRRRLLISRALVHQPRLVLLDEPTVGLDPQVRQELWALVDALRAEGVSILMSTHYIEEAQRLADTVTIMAEGSAVATGPPDRAGRRARRPRGDRGLRLAGAARGGRGEAREAGFNTRRTGTSVSVLGVERANGHMPEGERRPANLEDLFVLLTGRTRNDGRARAHDRPPRAPRAQGRARARDHQLLLVLEVERLLVDRRADDLPARVRLRLRLARHVGRRPRLRPVRRHRHGRHRGAVLVRLRAMFGSFVKYQFQRTYDAILAAPVDTEELVTAEALWIAARAGVFGCAPLLVAMVFGLKPSWGMLLVPFIGALTGYGWACFGVTIAAVLNSIDHFSYITSTIITPVFLTAGTFFPISGCPSGRRCSRSSTRSTTACSSCATPASGSRAGSTSTTWARSRRSRSHVAAGDPLHAEEARRLVEVGRAARAARRGRARARAGRGWCGRSRAAAGRRGRTSRRRRPRRRARRAARRSPRRGRTA